MLNSFKILFVQRKMVISYFSTAASIAALKTVSMPKDSPDSIHFSVVRIS